MIDLRYINGRLDALADCAVRMKSGGIESTLAYIEEQIGMCRQAETELLEDMMKESEDEIERARRLVG